MARNDLAEVTARFGAELRRAGLPVGPGRSERFANAVTIARPQTLDALYRCALATLVSSRDDINVLRSVFNQVFGGLGDPASRRGTPNSPALPLRPPVTPEDLLAKAARAAKSHVSDTQSAPTPDAGEDDADAPEPEREIEHRYLGSTVERLAGQDFAELSEDELLLQRLFLDLFQIMLVVVRLDRRVLVLLFLDDLFLDDAGSRRISRDRRNRRRRS